MDTETLRPNAAGDECTLPMEAGDTCPNHYLNVDEVETDEHTTRVQNNTSPWQRDLYNIEDHGVGSGIISGITVYARCKNGFAPGQTSLKIAIKTGGTAYEGGEQTLTGSYADYHEDWAQNPGNAHAWTWDEIDALQAGITLRQGGFMNDAHCTQVWVVVDYTSVTIHEKEVTDAIAFTDTLVKTPMLMKSDGVALSDVLIKTASKTLSDAIALTDIVTKYRVIIKTVTDSIAMADTLVKTVGKVVSDGIAFTDVLWKVWIHAPLRILKAVRNLLAIRNLPPKR